MAKFTVYLTTKGAEEYNLPPEKAVTVYADSSHEAYRAVLDAAPKRYVLDCVTSAA